MSALPLTAAALDDVIAWRPDGPRRVRDLLAEAAALAASLPAGDWLLNVCEDRWRFAVGFVAGLLAGKVSLQPSSHSAETLGKLSGQYPGLVCLVDGAFDSHGLPCVSLGEPVTPVDAESVATIPHIAADRVAAILFTSGSTGQPQPHAKTWGKLAAAGRQCARRLGLAGRPHTLIGTVPVQHCFGFEATFLLALHGGCAFWSGKPFYPQDVADALASAPRPRLLVTTPFHLATVLASGLDLPAIDLMLSATAPLSSQLAGEAEARYRAPLLEIYGSTETGQVATRRTAAEVDWLPLEGVQLEQAGEETFAQGGHIETRVALADRIERLASGRIRLLGRQADLINIAGKRTSLAYLNHQIAAVPGVVDAAFFLPDDQAGGITRLAAFVVAPGLERARLTAELRQRIDPLFLPRPLVYVDRLPRNATGKLPHASLATLYAERAEHGR